MKHLNEYNVFDNLATTANPLEEIKSGIQFIEWAINDMQFNPASEHYTGFLNVGIDMIEDDSDLTRHFQNFHKHLDAMKSILKDVGFWIEDYADEDETIIHHKRQD